MGLGKEKEKESACTVHLILRSWFRLERLDGQHRRMRRSYFKNREGQA
jgi:hypothetical protein